MESDVLENSDINGNHYIDLTAYEDRHIRSENRDADIYAMWNHKYIGYAVAVVLASFYG
jgi:hypothetical protein